MPVNKVVVSMEMPSIISLSPGGDIVSLAVKFLV